MELKPNYLHQQIDALCCHIYEQKHIKVHKAKAITYLILILQVIWMQKILKNLFSFDFRKF